MYTPSRPPRALSRESLATIVRQNGDDRALLRRIKIYQNHATAPIDVALFGFLEGEAAGKFAGVADPITAHIYSSRVSSCETAVVFESEGPIVVVENNETIALTASTFPGFVSLTS